jgi:hypothetical protein
MKNQETLRSRHAGYSLLEFSAANAILLAMVAVAIPNLLGYRQEAALMGAAETFRFEFMKARSVSSMKNTQTAIRFEKDSSGVVWYSTYVDGNFNGVLAADIKKGIDARISGPFRLDAGKSGVEVGVLPGVTGPDGSPLGLEPLRFGNSKMISFSPIGTGTPGTFYLRTRTSMAGVRVTGGSARVRIMLLRGKKWIDRQG